MRFIVWESPYGYMGAKASEVGLTGLTLPREREEDVLEELYKNGDPGFLDKKFFAPLLKEIDCYFNKEGTEFSQPLDWEGVTPFRQKVLQAVAQIPYGEVRSYKWVGESIGHLKGFRAIGQAVGANPFPILIPCHRVIASNGGLCGYTGGLDFKRKFLKLEGVTIPLP